MARVVGASRPGASVSRLSRLGRFAAIRAASVAALGGPPMASACCSDPDRAADPMARVVGASRPGASVSRLSRLGRCAAIRAASVAALGVVAYGIRLLL